MSSGQFNRVNIYQWDRHSYLPLEACTELDSVMTHGNNNKKNFEVYTAEEFIAAHSISLRNHFRTCAELDSVWYVTMDGIQINHEGYVTSRGPV